MEKEHLNNKILSTFLIVLLISSAVTVLALMTVAPVSAENSWGGFDRQYLDPTNEAYACPIGPGADSGNTFFNPGPAPNTPNIKWTKTAADVGMSGSFASTTPAVAFEGKLIVFASSPNRIVALDPQTGAKIWEAPRNTSARGFGTATLFKVSDGYVGWEHSRGVEIHRTSDGALVGLLTTTSDGDGLGSFGGGSVVYWGGFYSSWDKTKYSTAQSVPGSGGFPADQAPQHIAVAMDLSDPANPRVKWKTPMPTGIESLGSAPGLGIFGGYGEGQIWALDTNTGAIVWTQWKRGNAGYISNYYEGKIYHSASSTELTCLNATTGEVIFRQYEGGRAFFVFGDPMAYGRYYGKNIALPNGWMGCYDANTGLPMWKTPALYNIAYLTQRVADGKLYGMRYSGTAGGEESQGTAFACWDAFTGDIIWEMPGTNWAHPMVAYGNLYATTGSTIYCIGDAEVPFEKFHDGYNYTSPAQPGILMGQTGPRDISTPLWRSENYGSITGSAVAGNGKVYFGSLDSNIYCLDADTGAQIWNYTTGYRQASTPALVGGVLYTGSDDGNVYALNAETGQRIWTAFAGGKTLAFWVSAWQVRSSPIVDGGQLFVGALDGKLYCINTANGQTVWAAQASNTTYPIGGTPLVESDAVYIPAADSFLYKFNRANGALLWKKQVQPTSGFDLRAQTSTPVDDAGRGFLWLATDTHTYSRINKTDGSFATQIYLNYSRGGTMTPAITTPAIMTISNRIVLYVGDGFQFDAYDITTFSYNSSFFLQSDTPIPGISSAQIGPPLIQERVFYRNPTTGAVTYISSATSNPTMRNNVNTNINSTVSQISANETAAPLIWARWMGHQVYSSPVIANSLTGPVAYFGDDVYSISAVNASIRTGTITIEGTTESRDLRGGNSLSVYTTEGQVFSSACIYDRTLYMGSQDGFMYAFRDPAITADMNIAAAASKTVEMWNNETLVIAGRLRPAEKLYNDPQGDPTNLGIYGTASMPNATVLLSLSRPDQSSVNLTATTDSDGYFTVAVEPDQWVQTGTYGWLVLYEGKVLPWITYNQAFTEFNMISVTAAPTPQVTESPPPTETPTPPPTETPTETPPPTTAPPTTEPPTEGGDMTLVYVAIAIIVIIVIVVAAYMYMKGGKKQ